MDTSGILQSAYLDLIFEGRNKAYGSYLLRKTYRQRMQRAGAFLLLLLSLSLTYRVMGERAATKENIPLPATATTTITDVFIEPPKPEPLVIPEPPAAPAAPVKTLKITPPDIIQDDQVAAAQTMASQADLKNAVAGKLTISGDNGTDESPDITEINGHGTGKAAIDGPVAGSVTKPYLYVEQRPEFPGGEKALYAYLSEHLHYPEAAANANQQGNVRVKFVVNEDGSISNIEVVRGFGYGSEAEATRVVSGMPKWKPGRNNGIAVKVWFQLPISFQMRS